MKYLMIGASAVALMALPAIAQTAAPPSPDRAARWNAPQTRADLEKKIAERFAAAVPGGQFGGVEGARLFGRDRRCRVTRGLRVRRRPLRRLNRLKTGREPHAGDYPHTGDRSHQCRQQHCDKEACSKPCNHAVVLLEVGGYAVV